MMVGANELLYGKKYAFSHLALDVLEKNSDGNVLVFKASYVKASLPGKISSGLKDFNDLTRLPDDPSVEQGAKSKRPPGYWLLSTVEHEGVAHAFFASDEWLDQTPKSERENYLARWCIEAGVVA